MIGRQLFLIFGHDHRAALRSHHHLILCCLEVDHADHALAGARSEQGCFIDDIGEVGAGEARRTTGYHLGIDIRTDPHFFHMNLKDSLAAQHIRVRNDNLTVETAGSEQRWIEHIWTVGGGD